MNVSDSAMTLRRGGGEISNIRLSQNTLQRNDVILLRRDRQIAKSDYELCFVSLPIRPSAWNNWTPKEWMFLKFYI
jgi:hypothetical protein